MLRTYGLVLAAVLLRSPGFMAQFGIHGKPAIAAEWREKKLKDDPVKESNQRGFISFATSGKDSRTTQMFINFASLFNEVILQ